MGTVDLVKIGVRKNPGSMHTTRIPNGFTSAANESLSTLRACLLAM